MLDRRITRAQNEYVRRCYCFFFFRDLFTIFGNFPLRLTYGQKTECIEICLND